MSGEQIRFLVVGNCGADDAAIGSMLSNNFDASIERAKSSSEASRKIEEQSFDLVLVNRIFDATGEQGVRFIAEQKSRYPDLLMMLISNYQDAQDQAIQAGAVNGFGKSKTGSQETVSTIRQAIEGQVSIAHQSREGDEQQMAAEKSDPAS